MSRTSRIQVILVNLLDYRTRQQHSPRETVKLGEELVELNYLNSKSIGDEAWSFIEQVTVAAIECGNIDLAKVCTERLAARFPGSPRVAVLIGSMLEGEGLLDQAREYYETFLLEDETNTNIRKRLISLHLHSLLPVPSSSLTKSKNGAKEITVIQKQGLSRMKGIELLVNYLDCVYNDAEGWAQLAASYAELGLYEQSLSALSHLLLRVPQNPYYLLRHAETAYTLGDIPLAYKEMLRVVEMSEDIDGKGGVGVRAAIGVKLCISRLLSASSAGSNELVPQIDLLVTKVVLDAYSDADAVSRNVTRKWLSISQ